MTARWVVEEVAPLRNLNVTWNPISLREKNQLDPEGDRYPKYDLTHRMLRVMLAAERSQGNEAFAKIYFHLGARIHHDEQRDFDGVEAIAEELISAGFNESEAAEFAQAFDDVSYDEVIRERMGVGLALTGDDVGTPIIALDDDEGTRVALFGPVISRIPKGAAGAKLWDGFVACAQTPGFWEVKRTRTERPQF